MPEFPSLFYSQLAVSVIPLWCIARGLWMLAQGNYQPKLDPGAPPFLEKLMRLTPWFDLGCGVLGLFLLWWIWPTAIANME